jgi:hypothetical protein
MHGKHLSVLASLLPSIMYIARGSSRSRCPLLPAKPKLLAAKQQCRPVLRRMHACASPALPQVPTRCAVNLQLQTTTEEAGCWWVGVKRYVAHAATAQESVQHLQLALLLQAALRACAQLLLRLCKTAASRWAHTARPKQRSNPSQQCSPALRSLSCTCSLLLTAASAWGPQLRHCTSSNNTAVTACQYHTHTAPKAAADGAAAVSASPPRVVALAHAKAPTTTTTTPAPCSNIPRKAFTDQHNALPVPNLLQF